MQNNNTNNIATEKLSQYSIESSDDGEIDSSDQGAIGIRIPLQTPEIEPPKENSKQQKKPNIYPIKSTSLVAQIQKAQDPGISRPQTIDTNRQQLLFGHQNEDQSYEKNQIEEAQLQKKLAVEPKEKPKSPSPQNKGFGFGKRMMGGSSSLVKSLGSAKKSPQESAAQTQANGSLGVIESDRHLGAEAEQQPKADKGVRFFKKSLTSLTMNKGAQDISENCSKEIRSNAPKTAQLEQNVEQDKLVQSPQKKSSMFAMKFGRTLKYNFGENNTTELKQPPELNIESERKQMLSEGVESAGVTPGSSGDLISQNKKKQIQKYASQRQLVHRGRNTQRASKAINQEEAQRIREQQEEILRLEQMCANQNGDQLSQEKIQEIQNELNTRKLALGAMNDIMENVQMGQASSEEFGDLNDNDEDGTPLKQDEDIKKQLKDIKRQREFIHRHRSRKMGILPDEIRKSDYRASLVREDKDPALEEDENDLNKKSLMSFIILKHNNKFLKVWSFLNIFSCLTSSYFYAYISAFGVPKTGSLLQMIVIFYEIVFFVQMSLKFITEYKPEGDLSAPVRDLQQIAMTYLKGNFIYDFIPIIPFAEVIKHENGYERLFYLIKIIRIGQGLVIFTTSNIMSIFKNYYQKKVKEIIKNDPLKANNMLEDNNNITTLLMIFYAVQITRLVLIIINVSFFLGIFWYIFCDLIKDYKLESLKESDPEVINVENFIEYNELEDKDAILRTIIMMYYMFTSLSTVGFGDYHPRGDEERLVCAIVLLFGVAIFSYFMGILFKILANFKMLNDDLDEGDELSKFFGLLCHFNDDVPIDSGLKNRIEAHFDYRWANDKNMAIATESDRTILAELPEHVENEIYKSFLFNSFLQKFKDFFTIEKRFETQYNKKKPEFYSWDDSEYRDFMIEFLQKLEPRFEKANVILYEELEEINEIFFVQTGQIEIGFELNKHRKFVIRYSNKTVIGGYNCTHDKRSIFVYKCRTNCEGYTIRKEQWLEILDNYDKIRMTIERNVETDYIQNIMNKVLKAKREMMKKLQKRADVQQVLTLIPNSLIKNFEENDQRNFNLCLSNRFDLNASNYQNYSEEPQEKEQTFEEEQTLYYQGMKRIEQRTRKIIETIDYFNHTNVDLAQKIDEAKKQLELEKKSFQEIEIAKTLPKDSPIKTIQFSDIDDLESSDEEQSSHYPQDSKSNEPEQSLNDRLEEEDQTQATIEIDNEDQFKNQEDEDYQPQDELKKHAQTYKNYFDSMINDHQSKRWDYESIKQEMRDNPIQCQKYNYSIANNIQNHQQYDATITIDSDGEELLINISKPDTNPQYIFDLDPTQIQKEVEKYKQQKQSNRKEAKQYNNNNKGKSDQTKDLDSSQSETDHNSDHEGGQNTKQENIEQPISDATSIMTPLPPIIEEKTQKIMPLTSKGKKFEFHVSNSSSSTKISDIKGIIYGGISSRFWMFRKHMITLDIQRNMRLKHSKDQFKLPMAKVPFYAWQCITLITGDRYVDLIIKEEKHMDLFIRFMSFALNTMDGLKNSAERTLVAVTTKEVLKQEQALIKQYKTARMFRKQLVLSQAAKDQIKEQKKKIVYRQTLFKYILMRVRCKISYHAFIKKMSINELFISQIYDSYQQLTKQGCIPPIANYSFECIAQFDEQLNTDSTNKSDMLRYLMTLSSDPVVLERKNQMYYGRELKQLGVRTLEELHDETIRKKFLSLIERNKRNHIDENDPLYNMVQVMRSSSPVSSKKKSKKSSNLGDNISDYEQQNAFSSKMGKLSFFDKSKCQDIFENVVVDNMRMYEQMSMRLKFRKKFQYRMLDMKVSKIKLMMAIGGLEDIFHIKCCLKKMELTKQMFALQLESGTEVFIPHELTCDKYPISFRYYDPIILISNDYFAGDSKIYHQMKAEMSVIYDPVQQWMQDFLGPIRNALTHQHEVIRDKNQEEIRLQESQHAMALQRSRYLVINGIQEDPNLKIDYRSIEDKPINLRFCHVDEVNLKRQKFVNFKHTFYLKQDHLKKKGQKFQTVLQIESYIKQNLDDLYKYRSPKMYELYLSKLTQINRLRFKQINKIHKKQLTLTQLGWLEKDKQMFAEFLLSECEQLIHNRRKNLRMKSIQQSLFMCRPQVGFNEKNNFLEERIETTQQYYDFMSDLNNNSTDIQKIRKDLYGVQKTIERLKPTRQKIDPYGLLENFVISIENVEQEMNQIENGNQ